MFSVSWFTAFWWAITLVVGEAIVIGALLKIQGKRETSFGEFADIVRETAADNRTIRNENMLVRTDNLELFDQITECKRALIDANRESQLLQHSSRTIATELLKHVKQEKRA